RAPAAQGRRGLDRNRPRPRLPHDRRTGRAMSTLRGQVLLGAALWTFGLMGLFTTAMTFHPHAFRFVVVVHGHPNALMGAAALFMAAGYAVVRTGLVP